MIHRTFLFFWWQSVAEIRTVSNVEAKAPVTDRLQMSLSQLELEPTIWHAIHFFSSLVCLLRGQKNLEAKNTVCSLPSRIVSTASKLKQTENSQLSLLRFGLIFNTILGFRIQTFSVPKHGNAASKSFFQVRNKKFDCLSSHLWQPFRQNWAQL